MKLTQKAEANPFDLTDDEVKALGSTRIPDSVRAFTARRQGTVGTETSALRKIAARAQAEVEAIRAIRALEIIHGDLADLEEAKARIAALERRAQALEVGGIQKDAEIMRLTAGPAAVVHSDD